MSGSDEWYYRISTGEVTRGKVANVFDRMGPYPDEATARRALEIASARNAAADERDESEDD
ncbi:aminotransferase class IV [Gordonia sp. MP11Mi]|uniref:SPOR domain-containing protein n=1 Tax=Gordonia sp. MP11Mi TaxID=3022769 RepID=A0AA97CSI0_9ACTN